MAKESMKAREVKRQAVIDKYAEKKKSFEKSWRL
jgi:small subunit ribosomal protein S14